jgi:hypothetical protein
MSTESTGSSQQSGSEIGRRRLLQRVHEAIRVRHYSRRTEEAYVHWIKRLIYFHGKRHPVLDNPREGVSARGREMHKDGTYVTAGGREGRRA